MPDFRHFIFTPKSSDFPAQEGPLCNLYAFIRLLSYMNPDSCFQLPTAIDNVITQINAKYAELVSSGDTVAPEEIDNMKEGIWLNNIDEGHIVSLKEKTPNCFDENINNMQDLLDEYGHNKAFAMLLGGQVVDYNEALKTKNNIQKIQELLINHGPLMVSGNFGIEFEDVNWQFTDKVHGGCDVIKINAVEFSGQHEILIIGCNTLNNTLYYIDPNYPNSIMELPFSLYMSNVVIGGDISYLPTFFEENRAQVLDVPSGVITNLSIFAKPATISIRLPNLEHYPGSVVNHQNNNPNGAYNSPFCWEEFGSWLQIEDSNTIDYHYHHQFSANQMDVDDEYDTDQVSNPYLN